MHLLCQLLKSLVPAMADVSCLHCVFVILAHAGVFSPAFTISTIKINLPPYKMWSSISVVEMLKSFLVSVVNEILIAAVQPLTISTT